MIRPIDDEYFEWLYSQVDQVKERSPVLTHWKLLRQLFTKEFTWFVPNDDNRYEDGRDLRIEFMRHRRQFVNMAWMNEPCSMLEMMVALSRRVAFEAGGKVDNWFWHLMTNLELSIPDINYKNGIEERINQTLDDVIWRRYDPSGKGGLFPLNNPDRDQREVELWYQMSAYILEQS